MHSFLILELRSNDSLMCLNCLLNILDPVIVYTMVMSKLNCTDCLTSMSRNLVRQLGLKGFHSLQLIVVRESRHGEGSLEVLVLPLALAVPPHLHLLHLVLVSLVSSQLTWTVTLSHVMRNPLTYCSSGVATS